MFWVADSDGRDGGGAPAHPASRGAPGGRSRVPGAAGIHRLDPQDMGAGPARPPLLLRAHRGAQVRNVLLCPNPCSAAVAAASRCVYVRLLHSLRSLQSAGLGFVAVPHPLQRHPCSARPPATPGALAPAPGSSNAAALCAVRRPFCFATLPAVPPRTALQGAAVLCRPPCCTCSASAAPRRTQCLLRRPWCSCAPAAGPCLLLPTGAFSGGPSVREAPSSPGPAQLHTLLPLHRVLRHAPCCATLPAAQGAAEAGHARARSLRGWQERRKGLSQLRSAGRATHGGDIRAAGYKACCDRLQPHPRQSLCSGQQQRLIRVLLQGAGRAAEQTAQPFPFAATSSSVRWVGGASLQQGPTRPLPSPA